MKENVLKVFNLLIQVLRFLAPSLKDEKSKHGIKETKEMIIGVNEVGLVLMNAFKDGVQFSDFPSFWSHYKSDPDFQGAIKAAWDKHQQIPSEIKDIDIGEGLELTAIQLEYVPKLMNALKKDK